MHTRLVKGLDPSQHGPLKSLLADPAMENIRRAVGAMHRVMRTSDYDNPSWSHRQAHDNGYNQAIEDVLQLITNKE